MTYVRRHRYWRWEWRHLDACKGSSECGLTRCQACKGVSSGRKTWCIVQCVCEREKESFVRWQGSGIAVAGWKLGYLHIIMGKIERGYSLAIRKSDRNDWRMIHVMLKRRTSYLHMVSILCKRKIIGWVFPMLLVEPRSEGKGQAKRT